MEQFFKLRNEKSWKSMLVKDNDIMLINKSYNSAAEFLEKFQEKGLLKERLEISILDIRKVAYPENEPHTATITHPKKDVEDTELKLEFESAAEQEAFVQTVIKPRSMTASTQEVSAMKAISSPLIGLAITALFTFLTYEDAKIIEEGGEVNTSGRRSLYKQLFAWLGETLGSQGALIAGGAVALLCCWFIYKNLKSKPVEVVYS